MSNKKVIQVANFFITKAKEDREEITNKKIQKLLYYAQAWSVTLRNKKIFSNNIQAWVHGPAVTVVYDKFSKYGMKDLTKYYDEENLEIKSLTADDIVLLEEIWDVYGKYSANDLEVMSHSEQPWQNARKGLEPYEPSTHVISTTSMKAHYGKTQKEP